MENVSSTSHASPNLGLNPWIISSILTYIQYYSVSISTLQRTAKNVNHPTSPMKSPG